MDKNRVKTLIILHLIYWLLTAVVVAMSVAVTASDSYPKDQVTGAALIAALMFAIYCFQMLHIRALRILSAALLVIAVVYAITTMDKTVENQVYFDSQQCLAIVYDEDTQVPTLPAGSWANFSIKYVLETNFETKLSQVIGDCQFQDNRTITGS